jgi:hypothetical protein
MHKKGAMKNRKEEQHINKQKRFKHIPRIASSIRGTRLINHFVVVIVVAA